MSGIQIDLLANHGGHTSHYTSCIVGPGSDSPPASGPVRMEELPARLVDALVGVGAEKIPLRLQQVCREPGRSITVVERECRRKRRCRHAILNRFDDRPTPRYMRSEEHTSELQARFGISYAVFCL